jgi:hypothetical protein
MSIESTVVPRRHIERGVYTWAALAAVIVVFAGFARSYYLKGVFGTPALTGLVHLHGIVMTLWFTLFFVQVRLVASDRVDLHRKLGVFGAVLALLVVAVGTLTAIAGARHGSPPGRPPPLVFLAIPLGDMVVFSVLVSLGLALRRKPMAHKRLLLLSSLGIVTAAVARIPLDFIRNGGLPAFFAITDLLLLLCIGYDTVKNRRLHPAFGFGFLFIIGSQVLRFWLSGTPEWLRFATWLVG